MTRRVCASCGAKWEEGRGFVEPHYFPCANNEHGWNFTKERPDNWVRPKGEPDSCQWNVVKELRKNG